MNTTTRRINKASLPPAKKKPIVNLELTKEDRVLPCPFCGSKNIELWNTHTACYSVECLDCSAQVTGESHSETKRGHLQAKRAALATWNTRTTFAPNGKTITTHESTTAP